MKTKQEDLSYLLIYQEKEEEIFTMPYAFYIVISFNPT